MTDAVLRKIVLALWAVVALIVGGSYLSCERPVEAQGVTPPFAVLNNGQVSIGTTATAVPTTALTRRNMLMIQNFSTNSNAVYCGQATVTTANAGALIDVGSSWTVRTNEAVQCITSTGSSTVGYTELALY